MNDVLALCIEGLDVDIATRAAIFSSEGTAALLQRVAMSSKLMPSTLEVEVVADKDYSATAICLSIICRTHTTYLACNVHDSARVVERNLRY